MLACFKMMEYGCSHFLRQHCSSCASGDPSVLVRLIHDSQLRLDKIEDHTEDELRKVLDCCGANIAPGSTKVRVCVCHFFLYNWNWN